MSGILVSGVDPNLVKLGGIAADAAIDIVKGEDPVVVAKRSLVHASLVVTGADDLIEATRKELGKEIARELLKALP